MASHYHVNPRIRAYGKARIDITRRARDEEEWQALWREPLNPLPFGFGNGWKFSFEYTVTDYAAEVGFFIDLLGFPIRAFSPVFAQFSVPGDEFGFSVIAAQEGQESTNPDTIRITLFVQDIQRAAEALESRGIAFEKSPAPVQEGSPIISGYFRSPHGVCIELIGESSASAFNDYPSKVQETAEDTDATLDELLGLPDEDDLDDGDIEGAFPEEDERDDRIKTTIEPEYVDESTGEDLESTIGDPLSQTVKAELPGAKSRNVSTENSGNGNAPRSLPLNSLRHSTITPRNGSTHWPAHNDKRNGQPVYEELDAEAEE